MNPPIRAKYPIRQPQPVQQNNFAMGMGDLSLLLMELRGLKQELTSKLKEVDDKIGEHIKKSTDATKILEDAKTEVVEHIKKTQKGDRGDKGDTVDEEALERRLEAKIPPKVDSLELERSILSKVPKIDTQALTKQVLKAIPENKASLKIIQEKIEVDPMSVIEKIMELAKQGKFKLKKENIDGLEQTMSAFSSQLGKGYLHGGGDTVTAGTNITITTTAGGQKQISSTGGSGATWTSGVFTGNGSTITFNLPTAATSYSSVFLELNGQILSDQNILPIGYDYTLSGNKQTITMVTPPLSTDIFIYKYS